MPDDAPEPTDAEIKQIADEAKTMLGEVLRSGIHDRAEGVLGMAIHFSEKFGLVQYIQGGGRDETGIGGIVVVIAGKIPVETVKTVATYLDATMQDVRSDLKLGNKNLHRKGIDKPNEN